MHDTGTGPSGGNRHIRALTAQSLPEFTCRYRFSRPGKVMQIIEVISVNRAEIPDHSPTLQAAKIAIFKISFAVDVVEQI